MRELKPITSILLSFVLILSNVFFVVPQFFGQFVSAVEATNPIGGSLSYHDGWRTVMQSETIHVVPFSDSDGIVTQALDLYKAPLNNGVCEKYVLSVIARKYLNDLTAPIDVVFNDSPGMLEDGYCHQFKLSATDSLGNSSTYTSVSVIKYDTTKPGDIAVDRAAKSTTKMMFAWSGQDTQSGVKTYSYKLWSGSCTTGLIEIPGQGWNENLTTNSILIDNITEATAIQIRATNNAGLVSDEVSKCPDFIIDITAPTLDSITPDDKSSIENTSIFTFDFYDANPMQKLEIDINGPAPYNTYSNRIQLVFPASTTDTPSGDFALMQCMGIDVIYKSNTQKWTLTVDSKKIWDAITCGTNLGISDGEMVYPDGTYDWYIQVSDFIGNYWGDISDPTSINTRHWIFDNYAPVGELMVMKTKLHPNGITVPYPDEYGVYNIATPLSLTGIDELELLTLTVSDGNMNTDPVDVEIDGEINGQMIYDNESDVWMYVSDSPLRFDEGEHEFLAFFTDMLKHETALSVIVLIDKTAPIIKLNGDSYITLDFGKKFTDPGATTDDGSAVTVSGVVNTSIAGTYIITYNSIDVAGNMAKPVIRIVRVKPKGHEFGITNNDWTVLGGGEVLGSTSQNGGEITKNAASIIKDTKKSQEFENTDVQWYWWVALTLFGIGLGWWGNRLIRNRR